MINTQIEDLNNITCAKREDFEELLIHALKEKLPGEAVISLHDTIKNNDAGYRALCVMMPGKNVSPNFRVDEFYELYKEGEMSIGEITSYISRKAEEDDRDILKTVEDFSDFSAAREHIYMRLISYNRNKERIEDFPYRKFLDLALVYYYAVFDDRAGVNGLIRIENDHLDMWGVSEEELYKIANENTFNKLSYDILRLDELILNKRVSDFPMLTLTNKRRYNGAVCIYYPSVLKEVSETLNSDLIIIPSSIHETIIVPYIGDGDVECCNNMIREVNKQHVAAEEVLSDHAYIYDRKSMSLS